MFQSETRPTFGLPSFMRLSGVTHELRAPAGTAGNMGVAVRLLETLPEAVPLLWINSTADWYPVGLAWAGLDPSRCLVAQAKNDIEALCSAEVALRGGIAAVVECGELSRLSAKRLALAASQGNTLGLVLRHVPARTMADSTAFASRWMVSPAPGDRLLAELLYAKGAMPGEYVFELEKTGHATAPSAVAPMRRAN